MGKEMKGIKMKSVVLFGIAFFLLTIYSPSNSLGQKDAVTSLLDTTKLTLPSDTNTASITFYTIGKNSIDKQENKITTTDALRIYKKYQELTKEITTNPVSDSTLRIQQEFIDILMDNDVIPSALSKEEILSFVQSPRLSLHPLRSCVLPFQNKASEWFCNFVSFGQGSAFPVIILPRLIPFLLSPIPRAFVWWSTPSGVTSVGGLISRTGFIAEGDQKGLALGFWGIGFSIFLPPIMSYGILGYALYSRVTAENIELWPPNNPPEITQTDPTDGQQMVPMTTTELRFEIQDADNELMSYNVTTEPNIGSGRGGLQPDGMYAIQISHLESLTTYTWHIEVTDGEDIVDKVLTFTTEPAAPILSNPIPSDGERDVPMDLSSLQFTLKDYQGDAMNYSVQTSPNIGYASATGIYDGTYFIPVSGLTYGVTYRWYVNVTDGVYWTRKIFSFDTGYPSQFDPYEFGWHYRKYIMINQTQVAADLMEFPVLIDIVDPDLMKAQQDGDDILFMNGPGVAKKQRHEIEQFDVTTGKLTAWVKSNISSDTPTTFYLYYGNTNCSNQEYPEKVWNSNYKAVWHLHDNPEGVVTDATSNTNHGMPRGGMSSSNLVNGKIGKCLHFDGVNDFISFSRYISNNNIGTVTAWLRTSSNGRCLVYTDSTKDAVKPYIIFGMYENGEFYFARDEYGGNSNYQGMKDVNMNDNTWHFAVWSSFGSASYNKFYFDGTEIFLNWQDGQNPNGVWFDDQNTDGYSIGALDRPMNPCYWDGLLDEIRIIDTPLSTAWIQTEYANQNNPAEFISVGPEESGP